MIHRSPTFRGLLGQTSRGLLGIVWLSSAIAVFAHEGHEPLPTKGATVDAKRGTIGRP